MPHVDPDTDTFNPYGPPLPPPFYLIRSPGGNVEHSAEHYAAGYRLGFYNVKDFPVSRWRKQFQNAAGHIELGPWAHVRTRAELDALLAIADERGEIAGVNIEDELRTDELSPSYVSARLFNRRALLILLGWPGNGLDLSPLRRFPAALEIFDTKPGLWDDCKDNAKALGLRSVCPLWGAYVKGLRAELSVPGSGLYCIDDAEPLARWRVPL